MPDKLKLFVDDANPDWPKRTPDTLADLEKVEDEPHSDDDEPDESNDDGD